MRAIFMLAVGALAAAAAQAAPVECEPAPSGAAKLICASPKLAELDEKLDWLYAGAQQGASLEAQQQIAEAQRLWTRDVRDACGDQACLASAYAARIDSLTSAPDANALPFVKMDVLSAHPAPIGKGHPSIRRSIEGDLVYSHYDDNGNTRSIVQFDFTNGHWTNLVSEQDDPELLAQDARYIVFASSRHASSPIMLTERKTNTTLAQLKLSRGVTHAFIDADRLVVFQGQTSPYGFQQAVAILALPSLKLIQETTLPGFAVVGIRANRIYTHHSASGKDDLLVFDFQLNELGRFQMPAPLEKLNVHCSPFIEQNEADKAVLTANCGEMHILDLKSFTVTHSIPRYAHFYSMALQDGLIFTAADQPQSTKTGVVVFDMSTGQEVAHLPVPASTISVKGNYLLAAQAPVTGFQGTTWPMATYLINTTAIRRGDWQQVWVAQRCQQAARLADSGKLYEAINLCRDAGIEKYAADVAVAPRVLPVLRQYGVWLSQTLDRYADAVPILELVQRLQPTPEGAHALGEARVKVKVIDSAGPVELDDAELGTDFAALVENGEQTKAISKTIDFGFFSDLFHFSGDRLYVGRYGCRTKWCDESANLAVFDRDTLEELASVQVTSVDEDQQDGITSIATDDQHVYVSVEYRYEDETRPNFFVIDRNTLAINQRGHIATQGTLHIEQGKLLACNCHFFEEQTCSELNPATRRLSKVANSICVANESADERIVSFNRNETPAFLVATQDYLIRRERLDRTKGYAISPREGKQSFAPITGHDEVLDYVRAVAGNDVVTMRTSAGKLLIERMRLPSAAVRTVTGLTFSQSRNPALLLHQQTLYVGYGRDLLLFDLESLRLKRYIKEFIPAGFQNNGHGLDENGIRRLIVDRERLIALPANGAKSRVVRVSDL